MVANRCFLVLMNNSVCICHTTDNVLCCRMDKEQPCQNEKAYYYERLEVNLKIRRSVKGLL